MHKNDDRGFYLEAIRYNEELAEVLEALLGELENPVVKKWAKSLLKRCRYHIKQHSEALDKLDDGGHREEDLVRAAMDLVKQRILNGTASAEETTHFLRRTIGAGVDTAPISAEEVYRRTHEIMKASKKENQDVNNEEGVAFSDDDGEILTNPEPTIEVPPDNPAECGWSQYHTEDTTNEMYDPNGHRITEEGYNKMIEEQA